MEKTLKKMMLNFYQVPKRQFLDKLKIASIHLELNLISFQMKNLFMILEQLNNYYRSLKIKD